MAIDEDEKEIPQEEELVEETEAVDEEEKDDIEQEENKLLFDNSYSGYIRYFSFHNKDTSFLP